MTPLDLQSTLQRLSLTVGEASRLLAIPDRTLRSYLDADRRIPTWLPRLLDVVEHVPAARKRLERG